MATMSQGSPAPALPFRDRSTRHSFGSPVTNNGVATIIENDSWRNQQYYDPQTHALNENGIHTQYGWMDSYDDSSVRPIAGSNKNDFGYMFEGQSHDRLPQSDYTSWYNGNGRSLNQDAGVGQVYQLASYPPTSGGWYVPSSGYMEMPIMATSTYPPSSNVIVQSQTAFSTLPPTVPSQVPSHQQSFAKAPFSTVTAGWSEDTLHDSFSAVESRSNLTDVDPLMPSVGAEFEFPGVGSFSIYEPVPALKIEEGIHIHEQPQQYVSETPISQGLGSQRLKSSPGPRTKASNGQTKKRQMSPSPGAELTLVNSGDTSFNDCVTVFETVPGAISQTKRRRKLSPSSHESFKVTRRIGACLECRFRKRPCAPGSPCPYCIKIFGPQDIAEVNCHRESPFVGYTVTDYFLVTSNKRIIDFNLKLPIPEDSVALVAPTEYVMIDGRSGPCSLPCRIPVRQQLFSELSLEAQAEVWRTKKSSPTSVESLYDPPEYITVPAEDDEALARRLETWAVNYAAKFSRYHSSKYPTAYAYNVGVQYISKQLPEHELVTTLLLGTALAYVLRAGIKCTPETSFRVLSSKIDTILYTRLRAAETLQFSMLQKLVWVSAGRLKPQQLYPVAYVLWQTMRSICLRASHLANLQSRFKAPTSGNSAFAAECDHLGHCFNLLLATHTALFRSNSPILLDFTIASNGALLGNDQVLIEEAMMLRKVILNFQEYSLSRPFKSSNWYRDNMYRRFRSILHGKGFRLEMEERRTNKSKVPVKIKVEKKVKAKVRVKGMGKGNGAEGKKTKELVAGAASVEGDKVEGLIMVDGHEKEDGAKTVGVDGIYGIGGFDSI